MTGYQPRFELSDQPLAERVVRPRATIPASLVMDLVSYDLDLEHETELTRPLNCAADESEVPAKRTA